MAGHGNRDRPAALILAPILPSDRGNGLAMRAGFLLNAYAQMFDVDLAVVPVAGDAGEITPYVKRRTRRAKVWSLGTLDTQFSILSRLSDFDARLQAFHQYGRPSIAAGVNADLQDGLMSWAGDVPYALVHVSRLYLASLAAPWVQHETNTPFLVIDCDEDDASAYRRLARLERKWGRGKRAQWLKAEALAFKRMAIHWLPQFDLLLAASHSEGNLLRARAGEARISVVPNTIPPSSLAGSPAGRAASKRRDIVFVGNMNYLPNIDAVRWFALRIWPKVRAAFPGLLRFVVVGSDPPPSVTALARGRDIVVTGAVKDVSHFYRNAALAIAPIRAGGGTRIKLLESAGLGIPIVATSFGSAGTGFRHGVDLLLADNETEFAAACLKLLTDQTLALRLAERASKKVRKSYDARNCTQKFLRNLDAYGNLGVFSDGAIA